MHRNYLVPLLIAATLALAACGDDKTGNFNSMGDGTMPGGGGDQLNPNDVNSIPENNRPPGNFNPEKDVDYNTLAADTVYFAFDSYTIPAPEREKLTKVATWLKANPSKSLFLAGHADIRGTPEYNRALGERRALAVREYLVGLGLPAAQLYTNSYGSDRPAAQGDTEEAYARNRRVEVGVIIKQ